MKLTILTATTDCSLSKRLTWRAGCPVIITPTGLTLPSGKTLRVRASKAHTAIFQEEVQRVAWDLTTMKWPHADLPSYEDLQTDKYLVGRLLSEIHDLIPLDIAAGDLLLLHPYLHYGVSATVTAILPDGTIFEINKYMVTVHRHQTDALNQFISKIPDKVRIPGIMYTKM